MVPVALKYLAGDFNGFRFNHLETCAAFRLILETAFEFLECSYGLWTMDHGLQCCHIFCR
jgi:hypothetical protein